MLFRCHFAKIYTVYNYVSQEISRVCGSYDDTTIYVDAALGIEYREEDLHPDQENEDTPTDAEGDKSVQINAMNSANTAQSFQAIASSSSTSHFDELQDNNMLLRELTGPI